MNGLLGASLRHSYSPRLHALLGDAAYRLFEVAPEGLAAFLTTGDFHGLNVTIPYKKAVLPYCAALSPTARRLGAVNTLVRRENGTLYGDNTDFDGFLWLLRRNFAPRAGELALVLGSGGAGVTVRAALESVGMRTVTVSRQGENNYVNLYRHSDAVLLVNATPVGMYPNNGGCLTDLSRLPSLRCVLDLVYNPEKTALLLEAERLGLAGEDGLPMLVAQARRSAELFRGGTIPPTLSDSILCKLRSEMRNIILIGMPGCGKTTVGRALAEALGRPFFDADEMLERRVGCSCAELLLRAGEEASAVRRRRCWQSWASARAASSRPAAAASRRRKTTRCCTKTVCSCGCCASLRGCPSAGVRSAAPYRRRPFRHGASRFTAALRI